MMYQNDQIKTTHSIKKNLSIKNHYQWFNSMDISENNKENLKTNVLRFQENIKDGEYEQIYKCEWIVSSALSHQNCEKIALQGRLRWGEEDLFNSLKNRGFCLDHDYSRNSFSQIIWHALSFFAFGIFELFRFSETIAQQKLEGIGLARIMEQQLCQRPTEELFSAAHLNKRIQFRYHFTIYRPPFLRKPRNQRIKKPPDKPAGLPIEQTG